MAKTKICSIDGCGKPVLARDWCSRHYQRWLRLGDPLGGGTFEGQPERWLNEVALKFEGDECLFWPFGKSGGGYGQIKCNGRHQPVHRIICEIVHGVAPSAKHEAAHSCGKGHLGCCNPRHLRWATRTENQQDKFIHGTHNRGERHPMAKLTEPEVREILALKGTALQREIAEQFGVSPITVGQIHRRKKWAHI